MTFLTGSVERHGSSGWVPVNIGDTVDSSEQLRVGIDSYCELQFGNLAVARIEANTQISIAQLTLGKTRQVGIALAAGAVVSKVQKLAGNDQYQVETRTAVAGVRGTEFRVATNAKEETELSVKKGVVTVIPPEAIIKAKTSAQQSVATEVEQSVVKAAPRVVANQQLVVTHKDFAPVRKQLAQIKQQIDTGASTESVKKLVTQTVATAAKVVPKPKPISKQQVEDLAITDTMQLLPTEVQPAAVSTTTTAKTKPAPAPQPSPVPFAISVVPRQAQISIDGQPVGRTGFSALYLPGRHVAIQVSLKGYDTKDLPVTVPDSGVELTVTLTKSKPPQLPLSISTTPKDAQILVDGKSVGTGSYQGRYEEGKQVHLTVKASGYSTESRSVMMSKSMKPVHVTLAKTIQYGQVAITTTPSNASISVNGTQVGTGNYRGRYQVGGQIQLTVSATGYNPQSRSVTVASSPQNLNVTLAKTIQYGQVAITTTPSNAAISVNGTQVGTGSYQGRYQVGRQIQLTVSATGYNPQSRSVTVASSPQNLNVTLAKTIQYGQVAITTTPSNASISVNGTQVGTGSYQGRYQAGTSVRIRASLRGYAAAATSVVVSANSTTNKTISLKPQPIEGRFTVSASSLIRSVVVWHNQLVSVDRKGVLRSTSGTGSANWQVKTGNSANQNSQPVVANNRVYLSGASDFVGVDAANGTQLFKIALGQSNAHLFGRSVTAANGVVYYPANNAIDVYGAQSGSVQRRIPLPSPSNMSALVSGGHIYIADQRGTLYELNASNGAVVTTVSSSAVQPVAIAPLIQGSRVFFVGRRGTAVLVNIATGKVVWQKPLDPKQSMGVFTDPVFGTNGIYLLAKNTLFGLSLSSGKNLFAPVQKVTDAPFVDGASIYYGTTDGHLVRANAATGAVEASVAVGSTITTRPVKYGGDIAVGTASGEIVLVYPATMPAAK